MTQYLGWAATAVFVGSYFCARPDWLRRVQMAGAALWVIYGGLIGAAPVVAANLLVLGAAAWTTRRGIRSGTNGGVRPTITRGPGADEGHSR